MRLLLAEDDVSLGTTLQSWLQLDGYAVDWVRCGLLADVALLSQPYDCVLLDRGLPGLGGDALLARIRAKGSVVPVLMITAQDCPDHIVQDLDAGADGYLTKPFDLKELSARIRVAVRRHAGDASNTLSCCDVMLNVAAKHVTQNNEQVDLTAREFAVLHALMIRPGHIVSRRQLESSLYGWGEEVESNAIEVHIHHLRKKLDRTKITTIRRLGYRLDH